MGRVFTLSVAKEDVVLDGVAKVWVRQTSSGGEGAVGNILGENVTWVDWNAWEGRNQQNSSEQMKWRAEATTVKNNFLALIFRETHVETPPSSSSSPP